MNRPAPLAAACLCLPLLTACVVRAPQPAPPVPPPASASTVLPGGAGAGGAGGAGGAAWYDNRRGEDREVVAGPAIAEDSASVTRTRGGLSVTASGDVRDTLDRRTTRSTVRSER